MFSKLLHLYDFVEQTVEKIYTRHPQEVQCKLGCADCCHAMFDISLIEACYLAQQLTADKGAWQESKKEAKKALTTFQQLRKDGSDPAMARIRCPLLAEDNSCRYHQARPINCRTYGTPTVINGQSHVCGLSGFRKSTVILPQRARRSLSTR